MLKEKQANKVKKKVEEAINDIKPSLMSHGGDVELVEVSEEGVVKVRLMGACSGCMLSQVTLKAGIESYLKKRISEVKEVVAVA